MKSNLELKTIKIESLSDEGRGVAKTESGKTIFIENALPLENVKYKVYNKKKKFDEGVAIEILTKSSLRINPECEYFNICGGCSLQHMSHDSQIKHKQNTLIKLFENFGKIKPLNLLEPITGQIYHYRHKARLGVRHVAKKEKILVGFREKNSNFLVEMDGCKILHRKVDSSIPMLSNLIKSMKSFRSIPQIEIAIGDDTAAFIFRHLEALSVEDINKLIGFGEKNDIHIYLQPKGPDSVHKIWPNDNIPRLYYNLPDFNLKFEFHPTDFTQINPEINRKMVSKAIKLLNPTKEDIILDLFCGLGNFTLPLAINSKYVIGVEGSLEMVSRGNDNARLNNINNVEFHAANLMDDCSNYSWKKINYNKIVIDPPRSGAEEIIPQVVNKDVEKILYISCNPATLARDAGMLVNNYGFKLEFAGILDMFPQTKHVESIALFERNLK